ncbi:MAG: thioesterase family protein [Snodgrassella sp.]|nr:thioesterase family protein [Snodgrassella sp.]
MSRLHIQQPELWHFRTEITVQIGDINYGNHLANDAVLRVCHEARLRLLTSMGYSEMDVEGSSLIMLDAAIEYKRLAF